MEQWNDRLKALMAKREMTAAALARATGVSQPGVKRWVDGEVAEPRYHDVMKICSAANVPHQWLMDGKGDMDASAEPASNVISIEVLDIKELVKEIHRKQDEIPEIKKLIVTKAWFRKHFAYHDEDAIKIVMAEGDSMGPDIADNDVVFVDIKDRLDVRDGVYAAIVQDRLHIKRLQVLPGRLAFISANPAFHSFEVAEDSNIRVHIIGRVVKSFRLTSY